MLLRPQRDDAGRPGSRRGDGARRLPTTFGNASSVHAFGQQRQGRASTRPGRAWPTLDRRRAGRGRLHRRRHRGGQLRPPRRRRGARGARPQAPVSPARSSTKPSSTRAGISRAAVTTGPLVPVTTRRRRHAPPRSKACYAGDRHRLGDARQQRDRHRSSRSPTWPRSRDAHGALFHTDAVQTVGKVPVDVRALGVDLLSLSGPQVQRPQGRRRALDPPRRAARAAS